MLYALLSDVHGRSAQLRAVLADARGRGADQIISLGDVGGDECLEMLREEGARSVFGNYEVSGWSNLAPRNRAWVRGWPPLLTEGDFLASHAAPWWPAGLGSVEEFSGWLKESGRSWRALFPYLTEDEHHLWNAYRVLESSGARVLFHGHTHLQTIWDFAPSGRMREVMARSTTIKAGHRFVVGVGSVGVPENGGWAAYTLYETATARIDSVRLLFPSSTSTR
jgi:predicted phosphodiesterase